MFLHEDDNLLTNVEALNNSGYRVTKTFRSRVMSC
jgi:hypothetical protein